MLETLLKFLKDNTQFFITVIVAGIGAVTLGWSNGCNVGFSPSSTPPPALTAPTAP